MWLSQSFKRVPNHDSGEDQDIMLPPYLSQTEIDTKSNMDIYHPDSFEPMRTDTEYTAGAHMNVQHTFPPPKTRSERLEDWEHRIFGTQIASFLYNNFIAGWRAGLLRAFLVSVVALVVNISIFAWLFNRYNTIGGTGEIYTGRCSEVDGMETGIKFGLNVLSTLILSASTFAMQGTTSPTREEVDKAHSKGKWLEIGTQSWRNLVHVSKRNAAIWAVLAITGLPLHLIFNAVFFTTTETYQYAVAVVDQGFLTNTAFQVTSENSTPDLWEQWSFPSEQCDSKLCSWDIKDNNTIIQLLSDVRNPDRLQNYTRLEPEKCIESYTEGFMQNYSDVVVVSSQVQANTPILWTRYPQSILTKDKEDTHKDPFHWVCHDALKSTNKSDRCSRRFATGVYGVNSDNWTVYGHPVDHCFARNGRDLCHLQFNAYIMLGVVVFSAVKVFAIAILVFTHPSGEFLRTIGDAITSFLKKPDPNTKDMCLVSSAQIRKHGFKNDYPSQPFTGSRPRWWVGANTIEFFCTVGLSASYVVSLCGSLGLAIVEANGTAFDRGLGRTDIQSLAPLKRDDVGSSGIVPTLLTANIPQVGFSLLYVFYTNIWSKLLNAHEFDRLTREKKGLRISERPKGYQRASHFFTLPTRYALPLSACSAVLHWLCSRSLFMARYDAFSSNNQPDENDRLVRLGYSATGIIALISVTAALTIITVCIAGFRRLSTELGEISMSVVISAACHVKRNEDVPWLRKVQWGDVSGSVEGDEQDDRQTVRHCGFTSMRAERPIQGQLYR